MKKVLSLLLITVLCVSSVFGVCAAPSDLSLTYDISRTGGAVGEDAHDIVVPANDIVTVAFSIINNASDPFVLESFQNEISFDTSFFEFVGGSFEAAQAGGGEKVYSDGEHRVFVNTNTRGDYEANQPVATFKLRVIETTVGAKSTIATKLPLAYDAEGNSVEADSITQNNLTVTIGEPAPTHTLTYNVDGAEETVTIVENRTINLKPAPEKEGFQFAGWELDGALVQPGSEYTVTKDVTLTAKWEEKTAYTVTFETGGGSAVDAITGYAGDTIYLTQRSVRVGYSFGGWYSDIELTNPVSEIPLNANTVVYAKWVKNTVSGGRGGGGGSTISRPEVPGNPVIDIDDPNVPLTGIPSELKGDDHFAYITGYDDGTVRPAANITRAEVAMIFYRLLTDEVKAVGYRSSNSFQDVADTDWFNEAVSTLQNIGLINGRTEDSFAPDANITRAEIAAIAARFSSEDYSGPNRFGDIDGHWAENEINLVAALEWIVGDGGIFRPDDNITRAETIVLVNRILGRTPQSVDDIITDGMITWSDNADTNVWYYLPIQEATNSHDFTRKEKGEAWTALKN